MHFATRGTTEVLVLVVVVEEEIWMYDLLIEGIVDESGGYKCMMENVLILEFLI